MVYLIDIMIVQIEMMRNINPNNNKIHFYCKGMDRYISQNLINNGLEDINRRCLDENLGDKDDISFQNGFEE
jgi:hypothetical protein